MAGKRGKKSSIFSRDGPVVRSWIPSCNVESDIDLADVDERYSDASSCRTWIGIDPFRCACNSAFGMDCRKLICVGVRLERAA